jgi:predicted GH43/DUF377 family glycosyl hydrolase
VRESFGLRRIILLSAVLFGLARYGIAAPPTSQPRFASSSGWTKSAANPVLGGKLGTCFDIAVLRDGNVFRMWFSWRPKKSIALVESADGIHWGEPSIVLGPESKTGWEDDVNRPVVLKRADGYHLWYTGQAGKSSAIGYAVSRDGKNWTRVSDRPVLRPEQTWEKVAVMCPHVMWDEEAKLFRMWYSAGEQYEPDAIGYATSRDGKKWKRDSANPIFRGDPGIPWERAKVTGCQVVRHEGWYYMFYIGFADVDHAAIGLARSRDGVHDWQRLPANPIIRPSKNQWDEDAVYKPFAVLDGDRWMLWYNGRRGGMEQIGLAIHSGRMLGSPVP